MEDAGGDVNINRETAAHSQGAVGFEFRVGAVDLGSGFLLFRAVSTGERLGAQAAGSVVGKVHEGGGVVDGNGPVVAGHIPVKLVVLIKKAGGIANAIADADGLGGVHRAGNVDLQIAIAA